jgi:hypothetical protein
MTRSSMGLADSCCDGVAVVGSSVAGKRSAAAGGSDG